VIEVRGRESGYGKVIAGNRSRGPSMTARRRRHPGSTKLVALTRGGRRRSSAGEAPKGAARATRVSEEVVRDRSGEAEKAPRRVRAGEGRKTNKDERELADRPTTGRERRQAIAVTDPLDSRSASRQGDRNDSRRSSRCVVKRTMARGIFDGLRSAGILALRRDEWR